MTIEGVDYAFSSPDPAGLAAAGKRFAMRYIGPGSAPKHLTPGERDRLWAAGLGIVLLAEGAEQDALGGYNLGVRHGDQARAAAAALGAPATLPIYFAVDFPVDAVQWPRVAAYLRGAAFEVGSPQVGVYGSHSAILWAARDHVANWFFQTYAWSGGRWAPVNHVEQYRNGVALAGGTVDLCRATTSIYGQWPPPQGDPMQYEQYDRDLLQNASKQASIAAAGVAEIKAMLAGLGAAALTPEQLAKIRADIREAVADAAEGGAAAVRADAP